VKRVLLVFRKEILETLRDRRTLLVMVVVPVLLYPGLLVLAEQMALVGLRRLEADAVVVALGGDPWPELRAFLEADEAVRVAAPGVGADPGAALRGDGVGAVVQVAHGGEEGAAPALLLVYDAAAEGSRHAREVVDRALSRWRDTLVLEGIREAGLPPSVLRPMTVADSSVALPREVGGYTLGRFLPMVLVLMTLLGAFYPAIDMAAGEKERGTLEPLLTAPVPAGLLVTGKFLAVALVGVTAAALNLASMLLTFATGLFRLGGGVELQVAVSAVDVLLIFAAIVPLAVLFGALFLGMAVRAGSFKEAQNTLTPVYIVVILPALLPLFPGIDFTPLLAAVPVAGATLLIRELLAGSAALAPAAVALGSTALWAWLGLRFASSAFGSERVLFGVEPGDVEAGGPGEGPGPWGDPEPGRRLPEPREVALLVVGVAVLFVYSGRVLPALLGEAGLLATQVLVLLLPVLLFTRLGPYSFRGTLALRPPRPAHLAGALLVIAGGMPLAWFLAWLQSFVLPIPEEFLEAMTELLQVEGPGRLLWLLVLLAVTPAICEEVLFRGALLQGTVHRLGARRAILLNALVFGVFHVSAESVYRVLPTLWLGLLLASVVWWTRSLWTGVLMHLVNNGAVVLLAAVPLLRESLAEPDHPPPILLLPFALLLLAGGIRVLAGAEPVARLPNAKAEP